MQIKNKKWKKIIMLSALSAAAIFLFEIAPRLYSVAELTFQFVEQKYEISSNKDNDEIIGELNIQNAGLKKQIGYIVSDYERSKNISDILEFVDFAAQMTKVSMREIKPGKIVRSNNLWLQPVEINITARFENFYNYIRLLEKSSKVMLIKKLTMLQHETSTKMIDINLKLEIYLNI